MPRLEGDVFLFGTAMVVLLYAILPLGWRLIEEWRPLGQGQNSLFPRSNLKGREPASRPRK
jgi:hypothetical protein